MRLAFFLLCAALSSAGAQQRTMELARDGRTEYVIVAEPGVGETGQFAARELSSYLGRISGAAFRIADGRGVRRQVVLRVARQSSPDEYSIQVRSDTLLLSGSTPRAVLYAAYDLLNRLGCRFIAPALSFYKAGEAELVPHSAVLTYRGPELVVERPAFAMRKLNVEEGLSHDEASLRAMVAWMPKARFNTISIPMDYGGAGHVRWDNWRSAITPELKLRGIDIEVGGHGYQNFLNAKMDGGELFAKHPDWFGRDSTCAPSRATQDVFNTTHAEAMSFVTEQAARYMRERGEIDILEMWPPDGARWAACASMSPEPAPDRQARLLNALIARLGRHSERSPQGGVEESAPRKVRVQTIAYNEAKEPPSLVKLDERILVDVCPIGQNFDYQIDDPRGPNNAQYAALIRKWRGAFNGHLGLYSYYRRYAWLSLPMILPRYMQHDLRWYATIPMQGISTYAEPGDWYTYELNHYVLGKLAWNPDVDVTSLIADYMRIRYGTKAAVAADAHTMMEDVVRRFGSIQYATPKTPADIRAARTRVEASRAALGTTHERLALMLEYASRDLLIQANRAAGDTVAARPLIEDLVGFHTTHRAKGVFLLTGRNDRARIFRHYGLKATE